MMQGHTYIWKLDKNCWSLVEMRGHIRHTVLTLLRMINVLRKPITYKNNVAGERLSSQHCF